MNGSSFLLRTSGVPAGRRPPRPRTHARHSGVLPFVTRHWFDFASWWRFASEWKKACWYPLAVNSMKHEKFGVHSNESSVASRGRFDNLNIYMCHVYPREVLTLSCKLHVNVMLFRLICFGRSVARWLEFKISIWMSSGSVCYDIRGIWSKLDNVWPSYINLHFNGEWCFFAGPANAHSSIFLKSFKFFSRQRSQDHTA